MLSLNATQLALVNSSDKTVKWSFSITDINGVQYQFVTEPMSAVEWDSTVTWAAGIIWDAGTGLSSIVLTDFKGFELRKNGSESGIIAPSDVSFNISNPDNVIDFSVFKGGSVKIELFLSNTTYGEQKIAGWLFRIKTSAPHYQEIEITAEDFLQHYLRGDYPNTRKPDDIFPSSRTYTNDLCCPVPFGTAYVPLRDVYITDQGYIVLGDAAYLYSISKVRSPRAWGKLKTEYSSSSYTFTQSTKADASGVNWRVFQAIIDDSDSDNIPDAHGFWAQGGTYYDPPVQFSRSDTDGLTNPAYVIKFVLKDFGIPEANIGLASFDAAALVFAAWGLTFNGAFWYKQPREKVLAQLLTMCHSCLDIGETINLRILSKTSRQTITGADFTRPEGQSVGSFKFTDIINTDLSDSGNVAWQVSGEAQDEFKKMPVAADGSGSVFSNIIVECPFVQDDQNVYRIGVLDLQRKLLKDATISGNTFGTCLALQPDDVITILGDNYGGTYVVLIDSIKIDNTCGIGLSCTLFRSLFDDWDDISPDDITIPTDSSLPSWSPVISGDDAADDNGVVVNSIKGRLKIGDTSSCILLSQNSNNPLISVFETGVEKVRMGNLNGFLGFGDVYGFAGGSATDYVKIDTTNGTIGISGSLAASVLKLGSASDIDTGVGLFANGSGDLRVGSATTGTERIKFASSILDIKSSTFSLLASSSGHIGLTATSYALGDGVWLSSTATTRFRVGNAGASRMQWDDTNLEIYNSTNTKLVSLGATNSIANWSIEEKSLISTLIGLHSASYSEGAEILLGHATLYASAKIGLKADGSGKLASGNILWDVSGNITSAGEWTATHTITGGTIQTAASGARAVLSSTGLAVYDATTQRAAVNSDGSGWLGASNVISWTSAGVASVAGFTTGSADLTKTSGGNTTIVSSGATAFTAGPTDAPTFTVTQAGVLNATGVTVSGGITATSGTFSGNILVSGTLQTSATAATGLKFSSAGIKGYGTANDETIEINADGSGWFGPSAAKVISWTTAGVATIGGLTANATSLWQGGTGVYQAAATTLYVGQSGISLTDKFSVTTAGVLIATDATITGDITATSGTFTGTVNATAGKFGTSTNYWSVGATGLTATSASTDVILSYGKGDFGDTTLGFILGYDFSASKPKFEMGNATDSIAFDGTTWTYTKGIIKETIIQMYTSVASLKTSATAGDGSVNSAGMVLTYEGLFGCGANQTATVAAANANVRILADGSAYYSGAISASTIDIGGADATSFHVDVDGNIWSGAAAFVDGKFKVSNAGALTATSATIVGDYKTSATAGAGTPGQKGIHLSVANNELYFYGDVLGTGVSVALAATIGISGPGDGYIIKVGDATSVRQGIFAQSLSNIGVGGYSSSSYGIYGQSTTSNGVYGVTSSGKGVCGWGGSTGHGVYGKGGNSGGHALYAEGTTYLGGNVTMADGAYIGQASGPQIAFDNTNNDLNITGCDLNVTGTVVATGNITWRS